MATSPVCVGRLRSSSTSQRYAIMLLSAGILAPGCHQPTGDAIDRQLIGEVMMNSEFSENLRALAMPGGRLSGSDNAHLAERLVADKLREYGLSNVHFEPFEMTTWQDRSTKVSVLDHPPFEVEGALSLGNCLTTPPEGITAELAYIGQGSAEDFENHAEAIRGKFAMAREGGGHRSRKMSMALERGAVGLIHVSRLPDLARVGQCHPQPSPEPGVAIPGDAGAKLIERLEAGQTVRVNVHIEADAWAARPNNVVGEIPGTGPLAGELVILGAHLDSWHLAEGAIDNGNGSATILETARALASVDWRPKRTVRFVWFMGEEHGLHGSRAYVEQHAEELDNIVAMINVDMPGAPRKLFTFGHAEVVDFLKDFQQDMAGFRLSEKIGNASWTASDHAAFMKQGVCALSLSGDLGPGVKFYHSTGDTYEQVDLRGTTQSAAVLAVLVRRLADAEPRPTVRLEPTGDEMSTH